MEHDSMGEVAVPTEKLWGAQTQRSLMNFPIGTEKMPDGIIRAFALLKSAAAQANLRLGCLDERRAELIVSVCGEMSDGALDGEFPLSVWQTGSGTQTNMNVNEVIANRANAIAGEKLLHPNDHANMSQSSNDTFPTALHIAAALGISNNLLPALDSLIAALARLEEDCTGIIKTGRTHLQDAVPIAFSQEISGWRGMLEADREMLVSALPPLCELALGGTAVGTGLNAPAGFAELSAELLAEMTGLPLVTSPNKFRALASRSAAVFAHGAMKALAADLMKLANDVRWLASGPRCGLGEISIPENEPGSSIMPGKVNPTQCEAVTMVAVRVMGNDAAVGFAASQGNFELNVFLPVIADALLQSVRLLSDVMRSFEQRCVAGIKPNRGRMEENLSRSLMLVTALSPHIGYENSARVAQTAHKTGAALRETAIELGFVTGEQYDAWVKPENMI